jgi:hypothetical protein
MNCRHDLMRAAFLFSLAAAVSLVFPTNGDSDEPQKTQVRNIISFHKSQEEVSRRQHHRASKAGKSGTKQTLA